MKSILVTGGAGFIGSHVVDKLLSKDTKVTVVDDFNDFYNPEIKRSNCKAHLDHPHYKLYKGDIRDSKFLEEVFSAQQFDAVIHLAARAGVRPSLEQPVLYQEVNVAGTQNIFELCHKYGVKKCLFGSSSSVYGINSKVPFSEEDPIFHPISPYAATKAAGELLGHVYSHLYGIQIICLRFFTVYGPRQRPDLAIHKFTDKIYRNEPIAMFGDGNTSRDYTFVEDIVAGILAALDYHDSKFEIINLGNSNTVSLSLLIETIETALGKKALIKKQPLQPGDVPITFADVSKARKLLAYEPKISITEGIQKFVAWYLSKKQA